MTRPARYTTMQIRKTTLAFFNEAKFREAGRRGESTLGQNAFLLFLLEVYKAVEGDTYVLNEAQKKVEGK